MGELYHGSFTSGLTSLEPRKSTHGTYVYATPYKELAILFSGRCGDDLTYSIYRDSYDKPWNVVERIPNGLETMFSNSSTIYTVDDSSFKNINTGFSEVVSEESVPILKEEKIDNVLEAIEKLDKEGKNKLYKYPNKPMDIPVDDSDLIEIELKQVVRNNNNISKYTFHRLLYLHPKLLDKVNDILKEAGLDIYTKDDLINGFENMVILQDIMPNYEQYIESAVIAIKEVYPDLIDVFKDKLSFLNKSDSEKIDYFISNIEKIVPDISPDLIISIKEKYVGSNKSFKEVVDDIKRQVKEKNTTISM